MKKILCIGVLIFGIIITAGTTTKAQEGQIQIGPGLMYGSQIENLGIKVDGYYTIDDQFRAGVDLAYYFPDNNTFGNTEITTNYFAVNLNGNYIFITEKEFMAYALAGINILSISSSGGGGSASTSETGLNLGAGIEYGLDFGNLFGELKLAGLGGDADQLVLGAGVRFIIN